jgi:diguanylate cyclase (GGDEF)-like protein/PAS domain S-box-containing protein
MGWLEADVRGRSLGLFFPSDDLDQRRIEALLATARVKGSVETEGWQLKCDSTKIWSNSVITALPDEAGTIQGFVVMSRDMTERKRLEDEMTLLATVDPLTRAYNRRKGDALIAAEFGRRARDGRPFAVLLLDIDHFKSVNDRFGHQAGDAVLRTLVETCRRLLRPTDMLIRWGGEEFLFLLPDTDAAGATAAAERVRAALAAGEVAVSGAAAIRFTVSVGIALPVDESPTELLSRADIALYAAKTGGRDRVVLAA